MKKLSKVLAVVALLFTTFGSGLSAFADHDAIQPTSGDLTIHKHWAEDNSQIGSEGNGLEDNTITNPPVKDVQFNVYKLTPKATTDPTVPPSEKDGAVYTTNGAKTELSVAYNGNTYTYTMALEAGSGKTDANGILKLTGLKGFYYVEEDLANSVTPKPTIPDGTGGTEEVTIASPIKPFVISVPMTHPTDLDKWNTDVHVYPKNQGQTPTKDMDGASSNSVNIGDEIGYNIKVNIPSDIEDYAVYKINDKLDSALTYKTNTAKAYVYKDNGSGGWTKLEIPNPGNANYTVTDADPTTGTGNENTLTVEFTQAGLDELQTYMTTTGGSYTHVGIEFTTIVNENVVSKPNYTIVNKGEIEFNNGLTTGNEKVPTTETETNVGRVTIDKKDQKGNALTGAEFQIANSNANATAGQFIKVLVDGSGKITDLVYPGDTGYAAALDWIVKPGATTGLGVVSGKFYATGFDGLKTHSGADASKVALKYYVVETLAPDGYNLLDGPVEVDFTNENAAHVLTKEVINSKGFKLPATGGMGLILLTIAGIVLIGLAVMVILPKKRQA